MVVFRRPVSSRSKAYGKSRKAKFSKPARFAKARSYSSYNSGTRGTNPANSAVFRGIGFPDKLTTNLVYSESIILTPSGITPTPYVVYKPTSLYDPNDAVGGGQPTFFDQLSTIYGRYKVNGCKMTASFSLSTQTAANIGPYLCGIQGSDVNSIVSTNPSVLISAPNTTFKLVSEQDGTTSVTATYSPSNTFEFFDDSIQARTNADPVINWYFKVFASPQGVAVTTPINVVLIMEYNATFSDLKQIVDA